MSTFILIHGAWHGGWVWREVADALRAEGHRVSDLTLTGLGEREHLLTPEVGLSTHVEDVARHLEMEELENVIAVGWSYGGMVLTGLLSRATERIGTAFYLDAFIPEDGKALADYASAEQENIKKALAAGEITRTLPDDAYQQRWGVTDEAVLSQVRGRLSPQPLKTLTETVHAPKGLPEGIRYVYLKLAGDQETPFTAFYNQALEDPRFETQVHEEPHPIMITNPAALTEILLRFV